MHDTTKGNCLCQAPCLGGDVKGTGQAPGVVDPVDDALPVRVLVVLWGGAVVRQRVPIFPDDKLRRRGLDVCLHAGAAQVTIESNV